MFQNVLNNTIYVDIESSYPIALLCEMSRSIGMGDVTVLKDKHQSKNE